jgi:acetyltransferase-like isoleucine patch superfamily enzyme
MKIIGKYSYESQLIRMMYPEGADLIIGNFTSIGSNVTIYLGGEHRIDWISTFPFGHWQTEIFNKFNGEGQPKSKGNVIIGNDVWIGDNVTIMSGTHIGDGAVVANNSHVSGKVKSYSVIGGNPAKFYFFRFNRQIIKKLLEIQWWNWSDEKINEFSPILCSRDYQKILDL